MSDFNSIKTQIQTLITLANQTTGKTDTNLTDCVNSLIAGYGAGNEVTFSITNTMTNCSTSNNATTISKGASYSATITTSTGYELSSVTITMGGTDITSSAYANGAVTIPSVTGNLVITANAIEVVTTPYTNLFDQTADGFTSESDTKFYTNWIPYNYLDNDEKGTIYHFKGLTIDTNPYKFQFATSNGATSALIYAHNANVQPRTTASYDSSVCILQHSVGAGDYILIRFEIHEAVPSDLIITANEDIIDD